MVSGSERTGIVLPYEQAAMRGEPMPEGLKSYDCAMFQNLSLLYRRYRKGLIDKQQAIKEKKTLLDAYRLDQWGDEVVQSTVELWKRIDGAASAYRLNPSIEAADRLLQIIYGADRKHVPAMSLEEFLEGKD